MEKNRSGITVRALVVTAMLSAVATVLMLLDFSVPFVPFFIKLDFSEFPALLASFALGPWYGVAVCLIKNVMNIVLGHSTTGGVGELGNFLLGAVFTFAAGVAYRRNKTRKGAIIGATIGAIAMAVLSVPINYYITYPIYTKFMPLEEIIELYQAIVPSVNGLLSCLLVFNMPFTFIKGMLDVLITVLVYKRLSPIMKGR